MIARGIVLLLVIFVARFAHADDGATAAVALFDAARKLMDEGQYEAACPKLAESQRLSPGMGTLFNLAHCHERVGRTASAWTLFRQVAAEARSAGQTAREADARSRAESLAPRLVRLKVEVQAPVPGLVVQRDGDALGSGQWGVAVPVDPGTHLVVASASGFASVEKSAAVQEEGSTVVVVLPPLEPLPKASPVSPRPASSPVDVPPPSKDGAASWHVPVGWTLMVTGGVGALVGLGIAIGAKVEADGVTTCTDDDRCADPADVATRNDAVVLGHVATGVAIASAAVGATGLIIWLTRPDPEELAVGLHWSGSGATLRGRF